MFKRYIIKAVCTALALGGLLVGCGGVNQQPLAPERAATLQRGGGSAYSNDNPFTLVFAPKGFDLSKARARAAKPTLVREATGLFSPRRYGRLEVRFNRDDDDDDGDDDDDDGDGVRVQRATFEVKKGAIDREVEISMSVFSGSALKDIGVKFTPSGLKFNPPATLELNLRGADRKDLQGLKCYHIEGSEVTEISVKVTGNKKTLILTVEVPGFSIYSLGDELIPEVLGP
ncbi:MAG: hypothetical protein A3F84_27025 [Candidatus Handelsmanbacteria bacterium RIFCSPLOWO2_12_FULL_64_10]|uniref:Uncharacterized protein n=1 Tax=Handelsmanbacteria sp. (strain RIFCSPLOWO2_12_FULL_64_10) TaxID=1817868 RepID=A0A1F6C8I5_HANXR|nr:MAG: hypothetical protein A3F84_27025 [Candidatus Handelsmanbacteria bacterium RIFCSPLOWO2_12_FULL_64_10]